MTFFKPKFWDKKQISFFSALLSPAALLIKLLSFIKRSITKTYTSSIPIICVGNIYLGGTGKTPLCIEIFSILKDLEMNPVFIRKEYKNYRDEVVLQEKIGPVFQDKKRTRAVNNAIKTGANIAILDDGFQDFSIKKNLSIVCFNETQWIGNGLVIPAGPLREELSALKRANCVVINGKKNLDIEKKILSINKEIKIFYIEYKAKNIDNLKNKKVIAFAGIGNPVNFFNLLKKNNVKIIDEIKFPDHYNYTKNNLENLINKGKQNNAILLTTEKDYLRIDENYKNNINYLKIILEINNKKELIKEIKKTI